MPFIKKRLTEIFVISLIVLNVYVWYALWWQNKSNFLSVYFLDIGQGDAIFIESPSGNQMLVDAGSDRTILAELSKIMPIYDKKIEVILATHADSDHIGGFTPVLDRYDVDFILESGTTAETRTYLNFEKSAGDSGARRIIAQRGMIIDLGGGVKLFILFPDRDLSKAETNEASIVAKLYFGATSFMLTGDAPQKIEEYLTQLDGELLQSDVLKIGHHGSKTSSSAEFVRSVSPTYAIIQAGKDNKYGHPHDEVIGTLNSQEGLDILGTYDSGTIKFTSDGGSLQVKFKE